jgi:polyhydroxybutyrate depolymerase
MLMMVWGQDISVVLFASAMAVSCGGKTFDEAAGEDSGAASPSSTGPAPDGTLLETVTLPDFPHAIDIYAVDGAERAVVLLHGGGGNAHSSAYDVQLNATDGAPTETTVDWDWLTANSTIAVFPQGQALPDAPNAFTWDNHVMVSGQDDVAFLEELAAYLRSRFGISDVYLLGHSNGAMMTNRMWCESADTFDGYVAIAGPASEYYLNSATPCEPSVMKPYFGVVGSDDNVIGARSNWEAATWEINPLLARVSAEAFVDPGLIGEWTQTVARSEGMCGETLEVEDAVVDGTTDTWSACDSKLMLQRVNGGGHPIRTLEQAAGVRIRDVVSDFFDGL